MTAKLQTEGLLSADHLGDVVGVRFSDEEEVALFIPSSGDVLLCTESQWRSLKEERVGSQPGLAPAPCGSISVEACAPASEVKSILFGLGACLV